MQTALKPGFGIVQDATPFWPMHHGSFCVAAPESGLCTWSARERIQEVHSQGVSVFVLTNSPQCWESAAAQVIDVEDPNLDVGKVLARLLDPSTPTIMLDGVTVPPYIPGFTHPLVDEVADRLQRYSAQVQDARRIHPDPSIRYIPELPTELLTVPELVRIHRKWAALDRPAPIRTVDIRAAEGHLAAVAEILSDDLAEPKLSRRLLRACAMGIGRTSACGSSVGNVAICRTLRPDVD